MMTLRGVKILIEEETDNMVEISRELELEMEPKDVPELLQTHKKTLWCGIASY